jgi:hypothetical protein
MGARHPSSQDRTRDRRGDADLVDVDGTASRRGRGTLSTAAELIETLSVASREGRVVEEFVLTDGLHLANARRVWRERALHPANVLYHVVNDRYIRRKAQRSRFSGTIRRELTAQLGYDFAVAYEETFLQGMVGAIAGHGVTGVRLRASLTMPETDTAPAHRVQALARLFGEGVEPSSFVVTVGFGSRPLGATGPGCLARFELMAWVDQIELPGLDAPDVLRALSSLGRMIHHNAQPGSAPWQLGHTLTVPDEGMAGWNHFLLARSVRPIETELGPVDVARVLPLDRAEAEAVQAMPDMLGGWGFVTERESADPAGTLARFRSPPAGPLPRVRATQVVFEPEGDTLRVFVDRAPWTTSAMRDVMIGLDESGQLLAVELLDGEGPRAVIELGPRDELARREYARVLQTDSGSLLVTMAMKRVQGHTPHPYVPWTRLGG